MDIEKIKNLLKDSGIGEEIRIFFESEISRLKDVTTCKGEKEMFGRQEAIKIIKKLIQLFTKEKPNKKNQYI